MAQLQEEAALHEQYTRVITPEPGHNEEAEDVCSLLKECYELRWPFHPGCRPLARTLVRGYAHLLFGALARFGRAFSLTQAPVFGRLCPMRDELPGRWARPRRSACLYQRRNRCRRAVLVTRWQSALPRC